MFMLSWIRSSDAASSAQALTAQQNSGASSSVQDQDDWVVLPTDHNDFMSGSCANLDLLSSSLTLYRSQHPAAGRTPRSSTSNTTPDSNGGDRANAPLELLNHKSRRQLKYEDRQRLAREQMERVPRYDPIMAKMRDQEFKRAKMARLGLRTGRILSSSTGGANSVRSLQGGNGGGGAGASAGVGSMTLKIC